MDNTEKHLSEQESLKLITDMIGKVKDSYHETGTSALLWGSTIFIANLVSFLQIEFQFRLPFSIWWIALLAIIPQVIISIKEGRSKKYKTHVGSVLDWVWIGFAITLFGLVAYQNFVPEISQNIMNESGWQLVKHYMDNSKPDEIIKPFPPSIISLFILVYAFPTLITGVVQRCRSMFVGAIASYIFFVISLFAVLKFDYLLAAAAALFCWFIPGLILRMKYQKLKQANV